MKRVVQFDMDGVLADFSAGYDALCVKLGVPAPGPDAAWDAKWNAAVWRVIRDSQNYWAELPPLVPDHVFERLALVVQAHDVYFVTSRPGRDVKWQTEFWLRDYDVINPTVVVTNKKGEFARAAHVTHAIDDKAGNAVYTAYESPETRSFLIDRPYNRFDPQVLGSKVTRVTTVEQFLDAVEQAD